MMKATKTTRSKNPSLNYFAKAVDRASDKFVLRLPDGMRDFIAEMAERNGRSMNAEIVNALANQIARFSPEKEVPPELAELMNDALAERIRRGEITRNVRAIVAQMQLLAAELDHLVSKSRAAVRGKE
jgi:hypothetical protein